MNGSRKDTRTSHAARSPKRHNSITKTTTTRTIDAARETEQRHDFGIAKVCSELEDAAGTLSALHVAIERGERGARRRTLLDLADRAKQSIGGAFEALQTKITGAVEAPVRIAPIIPNAIADALLDARPGILIERAMADVFAIDDFARRYADEPPFSDTTIRRAVSALSGNVVEDLSAAFDALRVDAEARPHIAEAISGISHLTDLMKGVATGEDISVSAETLAAAMFGFVVQIGRHIELAAAACGADLSDVYRTDPDSRDPNRVPASDESRGAA